MNMIRKLPTPKEIKELYPLSDKIVETKKQRDKEIADVFTGKSNKFLLIIGPCSADKEEPVLDYISRLVPVQEQVKDKILIIPRIYTNKPRTTGEGYKGMIHQPDPTKKEDMLEGLIKVRSLHTKAIEQTGFTCADEMKTTVICLIFCLMLLSAHARSRINSTGLHQAEWIFLSV